MILAILAAAAVAQGQADAAPPQSATASKPVEVSPLIVRPKAPAKGTVRMNGADDWVHKPDNATILSVWPAGAYEARVSGKAMLSCKVDTHGLAEECEVVSEYPKGLGFGDAALRLRPTFKLKPAMGPSGPVTTMMNIPVEFNAEDNDNIGFGSTANNTNMEDRTISLNGTRPEMRAVTVLDHPIWAQAAGFDDLARAYPANGGGIEGYAVAHCQVERSGALTGCEVRKEVPENHGFGKAAVSLAARFRVTPDSTSRPHKTPLWVDIPIRFPPPAEVKERTIESPTWVAGFDPDRVLKLFPPEAAAQGVTTGRGVAHCTVAPDGALTDCTPGPGDPAGLGFSEAAVKLASGMRMNPWSADGAPVDGAVVNIPIRLNLASKK
jgi:TonB family protein